uniref:Uncharacterized protein n=1 Tax=Ditylenchus dipsaci TaxID=166011 RepID=A0A915DE88_9BILA
MVIPLKPLQSNVESIADNEAAYVSQNVTRVDNENNRNATNLSSSSNIYSSQTILGLSENVLNEASVPTHQDFTVPPPIDFLAPLPIDFTKPPPMFITPSTFGMHSSLPEKEINYAGVEVEDSCGYDVSTHMADKDDGTSIFPISTVYSSKCQQVPSDAARIISQPILPIFQCSSRENGLNPERKQNLEAGKRATTPEHKSREKKHKRSKRDGDDRPPGIDDSETEMASVFQRAFVCKQELKSPSKDGLKRIMQSYATRRAGIQIR